MVHARASPDAPANPSTIREHTKYSNVINAINVFLDRIKQYPINSELLSKCLCSCINMKFAIDSDDASLRLCGVQSDELHDFYAERGFAPV